MMVFGFGAPLTLVFAVAFGSSAIAQCQGEGQVAGPIGDQSKYYYSSACFTLAQDQTLIKDQVCSVDSSKRLVFWWTKLNWVSGSTGVQFGSCLGLTKHYSAVKIAGSEIRTNDGANEQTDVYVPNLGNEGNKIYWITADGEADLVDDAERHPFYFQIVYQPDDQNTTVRIKATMAGENTSFYLFLPSSIKSVEQLNQFVGGEYIKKISPLVRFDIVKATKFSDGDILLSKFLDENKATERGAVSMRSEKDTTQSAEFVALGSLHTVVSGMTICLGEGDRIATCFNN